MHRAVYDVFAHVSLQSFHHMLLQLAWSTDMTIVLFSNKGLKH